MTKKELIEKIQTTRDWQDRAIGRIPDDAKVDNVDVGHVFASEMDSFDECMSELRKYAETAGKYTLSSYYMSADNNSLAITYNFSEFGVVLFCRDVDEALRRVGRGKCSIQSRKEVTNSKVVVCEVE